METISPTCPLHSPSLSFNLYSLPLPLQPLNPTNNKTKMTGQSKIVQMEPGASKPKKREAAAEEDSGVARLRKHRKQMAGRVCVPETWGKESMLKDWRESASVIERSLALEGLSMARRALVASCRHVE